MRASVTVLTAVLMMAASPSYAQVSGGAKVGINFADISIENDEDLEEFDTKTGLVAGGFIEAPLTERISIQPEVLYVQGGGKVEETDFTFVVDADLIQIPILVKAAFAGGRARPYIVFGPGFGFITSVKARLEESSGAVVDEDDIKDEIKSVSVSGIIGAGVEIGRAIVEVRYDHGFNNLDDTDDPVESKVRNVMVLFGIGFGGQ